MVTTEGSSCQLDPRNRDFVSISRFLNNQCPIQAKRTNTGQSSLTLILVKDPGLARDIERIPQSKCRRKNEHHLGICSTQEKESIGTASDHIWLQIKAYVSASRVGNNFSNSCIFDWRTLNLCIFHSSIFRFYVFGSCALNELTPLEP